MINYADYEASNHELRRCSSRTTTKRLSAASTRRLAARDRSTSVCSTAARHRGMTDLIRPSCFVVRLATVAFVNRTRHALNSRDAALTAVVWIRKNFFQLYSPEGRKTEEKKHTHKLN